MKKVVLTGGPGAGKTTIAEVLDKAFPEKLVIVPEAASLLFTGGFPRWDELDAKKAIQRAIYHTQVQLEVAYEAHYPGKILILDRSTLDGSVYWPERFDDFFTDLKTTKDVEFDRYSDIIYLESAGKESYDEGKHRNSHRKETWSEAQELDRKNLELWSKHPGFHFISNRRRFSEKISEVLDIIETIFSA